jgi:hypothetical protein
LNELNQTLRRSLQCGEIQIMSRFHSRREFLHKAALAAGAAGASSPVLGAAFDRPLPVAGVVSLYKENTHADVILGKILEGYDQRGGPGPALKLASLYIDQPEHSKLGLDMARRHRVPVFDTIHEAVSAKNNGAPVEGIICIGEHGSYPDFPKTGQKMYPRLRFFDETVAALKADGRRVPIFNDKHLSWNWREAKSMYDTARRMKLPFMAGSSIPVAWRIPELTLPRGCEIQEAMAIGYGGSEAYGFHALEGLQCMVERRGKGEAGVKSVRAVRGEAIWEAQRAGLWSRDLLDAALRAQPNVKQGDIQKLLTPESSFFLIEYRDGLRATVALLNGVARHFGFAARINGQREPQATWIRLEETKPYRHFAWLLKGIEHLVHRKAAPYPVERTLLTTGILDRVMHSLAEDGRRFETPELDVSYRPTNGGHADREFPLSPLA